MTSIRILVIALAAIGSSALHADFHWSPGETTKVGSRTITIERGRLHGLRVDGLRRVTLTHPDGGQTVRQFGLPRTTPPARVQLGQPTRWDVVSDHLRVAFGVVDEWTPALGPVEACYISVDGALRLALRHRLRIGLDGGLPVDELEIDVDAASERVIRAESILRHVDAGGTVLGRVPTAGYPYSPSATYDDVPLAGLGVFSPVYGEVLTDLDGTFVFDLPPGTSTFVTAELDSPFFTIFGESGSMASFLALIDTAGPPLDIVFNEVPTEFTTAETSSFAVIAHSRNWLDTVAPGFAPLDAPFSVNVNQVGSCYAFYSPIFSSLNFARAGGICANAAYGTVVAHEYYHHLQTELPPITASYAEAMADTFAAYLHDDPIIAPDWFGPGTQLRDLSEPHLYPSSSTDPVEQGLPLAAAFWTLRSILQSELGDEPGATLAAELWLASQLIGNGEVTPDVVTDVLIVDDNDGDLGNGTPHRDFILEAFAIHGFPAPLLPITGLECVAEEALVHLGWDERMGGTFDTVLVLRDGGLLATLPGSATQFTDAGAPPGAHLYTLTGTANQGSTPPALCTVEVDPYAEFIRGDVNRDGEIQITDVIEFLGILFLDADGYDCHDSLDVDDDGALRITDAVVLLNFLFLSGVDPASPYPDPSFDPTPDGLGCL